MPTIPTAAAVIDTAVAGSTAKPVLTDASDGHTLYLLEGDTTTAFTCTASNSCIPTWTPLLTAGTPTAGPGSATDRTKLGLVARTFGTTTVDQVTHNSHPLCRYSGDSAAGSDNG